MLFLYNTYLEFKLLNINPIELKEKANTPHAKNILIFAQILSALFYGVKSP